MVSEMEPSFARGTPFPALSCTVNETVGALPAVPFATLVIFTSNPAIRVSGFCGYVSAVSVGTTCAPLIDASNGISPCGIWHVEQSLSSNCGPPGWFTPVAKFTSSWHDPQASRLGVVRNAVAWVAPVVWLWQTSQRRTSAGSTTVEKSLTEFM